MMIYFIFFGGLLFILLPFIPTIMEVTKMTDGQPLKISNHILRDPRSTPELLFWHFAQLMGLDDLAALKEKIFVEQPLVIQGSALIIPGGTIPSLEKKIGRVISAESISLIDRTNYPSKILSMKSITTGQDSALFEVHALEALTISKRNKVVWWASGHDVTLEAEVNVPGKIQAKNLLRINGTVRFHLFEGTEISSGEIPTREPEVHTSSVDLLTRMDGDFTLEPNGVLQGSLVVFGKFTAGKNSKVLGSVKAHGDIELESGAIVFGNVFGTKNGILHGNNFVEGSLLLQQNLVLKPNSQVGHAKRRVTCSAQNIRIEGAFKVFGMLRAWKSGECR